MVKEGKQGNYDIIGAVRLAARKSGVGFKLTSLGVVTQVQEGTSLAA